MFLTPRLPTEMLALTMLMLQTTTMMMMMTTMMMAVTMTEGDYFQDSELEGTRRGR
jgi:hypothetical protein